MNIPMFIKYFKVSIHSKHGVTVGYSKVQHPHENGGDFITVFSQTTGAETVSVKLSDVERFVVTPVYHEDERLEVNVGDINITTRPLVCRSFYKGRTVGQLIDLTIKSIDAFQETGDSKRHREELSIIREEMKISHSLNRY
ncbi:hypothetical protein ACFYLL_12990 [Proteus mirabilis]|uniref:hypothetical protein n=1 Tax=Proteus mirabilis TaxID=584 RepID=UPI0024E0F45E|nr:hypothetical protein [Proteus mirabilis]EKW4023847.1 hypothetical protein [Proteus mirabilis]HEK3117229.1 hypothetical protein [Proteus mirabilis]